MKQTPVKGTCDYLPNEMNVRDRMQQIILDTYKSCGYMHISTPILEDIENLNKSERVFNNPTSGVIKET